MKKDIEKLVEKFGKDELARMLGITRRHLNNCLNEFHIGGPLKKLIRIYLAQIGE